ncbi:hypothetical protein F2P81_022719 [Scophthalmus maximus]|uniref:Uncharacterized protein n=1 Tax=Scophthalmus maximus TaxID=52904 RepID=A0A6A4S123_SCOMX|nr:hypothetical protein F2P81_022719 [Scophthalmus maximus]
MFSACAMKYASTEQVACESGDTTAAAQTPATLIGRLKYSTCHSCCNSFAKAEKKEKKRRRREEEEEKKKKKKKKWTCDVSGVSSSELPFGPLPDVSMCSQRQDEDGERKGKSRLSRRFFLQKFVVYKQSFYPETELRRSTSRFNVNTSLSFENTRGIKRGKEIDYMGTSMSPQNIMNGFHSFLIPNPQLTGA